MAEPLETPGRDRACKHIGFFDGHRHTMQRPEPATLGRGCIGYDRRCPRRLEGADNHRINVTIQTLNAIDKVIG